STDWNSTSGPMISRSSNPGEESPTPVFDEDGYPNIDGSSIKFQGNGNGGWIKLPNVLFADDLNLFTVSISTHRFIDSVLGGEYTGTNGTLEVVIDASVSATNTLTGGTVIASGPI